MKPAVLLLLFLAAGCSSGGWLDRSESPSRAPQAVAEGDEAAVAALESCKARARAVIQRDDMIDRDIGGASTARGAPGLDWRTDNELDVVRNMDAFETRQRYERIVDTCMRQRGYPAPSEESAP